MLLKLVSSCCLVLASLLWASQSLACEQALPATGSRDDVLIIVNDNAMDSCELGRYYAEKRQLGQNNFLHVRTPAAFFVTWAEFKSLRDQILRQLQQRVLSENPGLVAATCTGTESPYYCEAVVSQIRDNTKIRYLVTTKGVPSRMNVDGSTLFSPGEATVADNYLKYWLLNYYTSDVAFGSASSLRARAFDDGRWMRVADPALDREFIIGRIDGITLSAAKAVVDRTLAAEANGIYGKVYSYTSQALYNASSGMRWKNYNTYSNVYAGGTDPWRYQFGMFNETSAQCADYNAAGHYLQFAPWNVAGRTPAQCTVAISVSPKTANFGTNDPPPGYSSSRQPLVDDSLIYMGHLDGQGAGGGSFDVLRNWRRNASCSNTLCENLPVAEQAACRAASVDVYKEIDTRCMGVADGFIGFNYQSFPVSFLHIAPTGWQTGTASSFRQGAAVVRTDVGADDSFSLWYRNNDEVTAPLCYSGFDFGVAPSVPCTAPLYIYVEKPVDTGSVQTSVPAAPDRYRLRFKYKNESLSNAVGVNTWMAVTEAVGGKLVGYGAVPATPTLPAGTVSGWQQADVILTVDHADPDHTVGWSGTYRNLTIYLSSGQFAGAIAFDDFALSKITATGEVAVNLVNPTFAAGHKQSTTGDHAANYLSRLNGVAFWGSMSHHESLGHSFSQHTLETMIYFQRGLPLGDAVWYGEPSNSGMLYGDPLYSPISVKLDYLTASSSNAFVRMTPTVALHGDAINGTDGTKVSANYAITYCSGSDFFDCDRQGSWQSTGVSGVSGQRGMTFGSWNTSLLAPGAYTLKLSVNTSNSAISRTQTYNDFQSLIFYNDTSDYDQDGLTDVVELAPGSLTLPSNPDMDGDGLQDGAEINTYHTNPNNADSDNDLVDDGTEIASGMNPNLDDIALDLDGDGVSNGIEIANGTLPNDAASYPVLKTVYVDVANVSGVEDGTAAHPYADLDTALTTVLSGDTVNIAAGDYNLTSFLSVSALRIVGVSPQQTRISSTSPLYMFGWLQGEIANLQFTTSSYGLYLSGSHHVAFRNIGVDARFSPLYVSFSQHISASSVDLRSGSYGMQIYNSGDVGIDHCLVKGNGATNAVGIYALGVGGKDSVLVDQCTVTNFPYGLFARDSAGAGKVPLRVHNTIVDAVADYQATGLVPDLSFSLLRNGTGLGTKGNLAGDPQFVNAAGGDYHLLPVSPAVGSGDPISPIGAEPVGNTRVNMGYYGSTASATAVVDLDADRLPDGYEAALGLNPTIANTYGDADADGFPDAIEFWEGTSPANPALKPAYRSVVLSSRLTTAQVVSLTANNVLTANGVAYTLAPSVPTAIPGLARGTVLSGSGPYSVGSGIRYTDTAAPIQLAGWKFAIPHQRNNHEIQLFSPYANATVTVQAGTATQTSTVAANTAVTIRIAGLNTLSTVVTSDRPILVGHAGYTGTTTLVYSGETNVVPPAVNEIWGVRSQTVYLGATDNGTQVTAYTSDGQQRAYALNAGQRVAVTVGSGSTQGRGAALRLVANKPIAAIQADDGDGTEQSAFVGGAWLSRQAGLPTNTQYLAIACAQAASITVTSPTGAVLASGTCTPTATNPGKLYGGRSFSGTAYPAGSIVTSTAPVFLYQEDTLYNEERNLFGLF